MPTWYTKVLKEAERKSEDKLKTYRRTHTPRDSQLVLALRLRSGRYLDVIVSGGDELPAEQLSREQLLKSLNWRTRNYKTMV